MELGREGCCGLPWGVAGWMSRRRESGGGRARRVGCQHRRGDRCPRRTRPLKSHGDDDRLRDNETNPRGLLSTAASAPTPPVSSARYGPPTLERARQPSRSSSLLSSVRPQHLQAVLPGAFRRHRIHQGPSPPTPSRSLAHPSLTPPSLSPRTVKKGTTPLDPRPRSPPHAPHPLRQPFTTTTRPRPFLYRFFEGRERRGGGPGVAG